MLEASYVTWRGAVFGEDGELERKFFKFSLLNCVHAGIVCPARTPQVGVLVCYDILVIVSLPRVIALCTMIW